MPSTSPLPSEADNYAAPVGMRLNKAAWDAAIVAIATDVAALKAQRADLQAVIDAGTTQAIALVNTNIAPLLTTVTAQVDALTATASDLSAQIDLLLSGWLPGSNVSITTISGVSAADAQAAIAELHAAIVGNTSAIATNTTNIGTNSTAIAANATAIANVKSVVFNPVTGNINLVTGSAYRVTATATLTLPATPSVNDAIRIIDGEIVRTGVRPIVARNGNTIMGAASDMTIDAAGADFILIWNGADWRLF